ncbi:unnamed protein product [Gongylonema pulchrum]|uniref:Secreted protein n=1 Tax=Gongylonema pulchrum TaxID=637853 RepID=A0A183EBB0_9BILA|nr:unnamed protein product [Gongylonema pulchrum]
MYTRFSLFNTKVLVAIQDIVRIIIAYNTDHHQARYDNCCTVCETLHFRSSQVTPQDCSERYEKDEDEKRKRKGVSGYKRS